MNVTEKQSTCVCVLINLIQSEEEEMLLPTTYRSHKWVDEACADTGTYVSDWQNEACGRPLLVRHVGQGEMGLGHANGQ